MYICWLYAESLGRRNSRGRCSILFGSVALRCIKRRYSFNMRPGVGLTRSSFSQVEQTPQCRSVLSMAKPLVKDSNLRMVTLESKSLLQQFGVPQTQHLSWNPE